MIEERFSARSGYTAHERPITIREEAPIVLRNFIPSAVYKVGYEPSFLRNIVCDVLFEVPDDRNWSERPNIAWEVEALLRNCEWYKVYDIIEATALEMGESQQSEFHERINDYFRKLGVGWKLENCQILFRGDESFEAELAETEKVLTNVGKPTAASEIKEAIKDLSRMPKPDITGAIQHSVACLECIAREAANDKKLTLGELIKKHKGIVPAPLDTVVDKIWAYSSEQGRHLREGREPGFDEAELLVGLSASISTYLARKMPFIKSEESQAISQKVTDDNYPF